MAASVEDFLNSDSSNWIKVLSLYSNVLERKAEKKSKPLQRQELIELDEWFQEELPKLIQDRAKPHITFEELTKLVKWKLTRGKFRPALAGLVASNKPEEVVKASEKAFKKLPNLSAAIQALTVLRGIGPATASAVLAAGAPKHVPFMADESVLAMPGFTVIRYDLNCYLKYAKLIQQYTKKLQQEDGEFDWNPHKVELAVWTQTMASQLCPDLLKDVGLAIKDSSSTAKNGSKDCSSTVKNGSKDSSSTAKNGSKDCSSTAKNGSRRKRPCSKAEDTEDMVKSKKRKK